MIIFDLDGTLADCEHRRHFVYPSKREDCYFHFPATLTQSEGFYYKNILLTCNPPKPKKFTLDWKSFYESCNEDIAICPVIRMMESLYLNEVTLRDKEIQIWSRRCESVREKTIRWLNDVIGNDVYSKLKMRPQGDFTPDDQLKEKWLDEALEDGKTIDFVFDDRRKVVEMWRRRGIFVFDVSQGKGDF